MQSWQRSQKLLWNFIESCSRKVANKKPNEGQQENRKFSRS